jgi:hypothetical protein
VSLELSGHENSEYASKFSVMSVKGEGSLCKVYETIRSLLGGHVVDESEVCGNICDTAWWESINFRGTEDCS